jgi:hypothetical protein
MTPPFEVAAFALAPGAVSEIIETPFGLHIIKVEEKTAARQEPLDAVRASIVESLTLFHRCTILSFSSADSSLGLDFDSTRYRTLPMNGLRERPSIPWLEWFDSPFMGSPALAFVHCGLPPSLAR